MVQLSQPSFNHLSRSIVDFINRNAELNQDKVWITLLIVYADYIGELGWDLREFKDKIFPVLYQQAKEKHTAVSYLLGENFYEI